VSLCKGLREGSEGNIRTLGDLRSLEAILGPILENLHCSLCRPFGQLVSERVDTER
jgi:hypothetical protein